MVILKRISFLPFLILYCTGMAAQGNRSQYEGQFLGWMQMFDANQPPKPYKLDHRSWSARQMGISYQLVKWIQQSYTPRGALGQAFWLRNDQLGLYNQQTRSAPQVYGTITKTLLDLKKNAQGKWVPETNTNWFMQIAVNGRIGDYTDVITTPEQYFFYIPGENGLNPDEQQVAGLRGFSSHPVLKKYIGWYQPKGIRTTLQYVILLCKDNIRPYIAVTKGEYLDHLEKAIERYADEQLKKGYPSGNIADQLNKRRAALARLRERYRNRLNEPAKLKEQPDLYLENESGAEIFENRNYPSEYTVYKFDPAKLALTKSDNPQWVVISWDAEGVATGDEPGTHLHQSMLDNVDYDYLYNYFFYPDRIRGIVYKPLHTPDATVPLVTLEKSTTSRNMDADPRVFFFEDFSSTPAGSMPMGWTANLNNSAQKPVVRSENGLQWVQLNGHSFHIQKLNKTLPADFTVSYDLFVRKGFHWGSPGLEFFLAGDQRSKDNYGNSIMVKIRPGFDDRDGWATVNIRTASRQLAPAEVAVPGFSNAQPVNPIRITIQKKGTRLQVWAGGTKVFDDPSALPGQVPLNHFYFKEYDQGWEVEDFYVTQIKITKE